MSAHFHPLRILAIKKETADCVSVSFEVPDSLRNDFNYKQGQSLTIRTSLNGQEVRRTYSLCSSPLDNEWKIAIKKVSNGLFSEFANHHLKKGDMIEVMQPVGKFYTALHASNRKRYIAFAAGSGITPILSLIKTTLATEEESTFTLVYGNRSRNSIIFFEELEALKSRYMKRFSLVHVLSREQTDIALNHGRLDRDKLIELRGLVDYHNTDEFFICGPHEMIFTIKDYLEEQGVNPAKIHFELFTTPVQPRNVTVSRNIGNIETVIEGRGNDAPTDGGAEKQKQSSRITVRIDGRAFDFDLPLTSEMSVLEAGTNAGADLPYACKGGVCCTCRAKLLEGRVRMDVHWGLEQEEIDNGYILTCQSHPESDRLVVDFDVK